MSTVNSLLSFLVPGFLVDAGGAFGMSAKCLVVQGSGATGAGPRCGSVAGPPARSARRRHRARWVVGLTLTVPVLLGGCENGIWGPQKREPVTSRPAGTMDDLASYAEQRSSPALKGTVGEVTYLQGSRLMRIRGFGLVVGLAGTGSRNCAPSVRGYLARVLRRERSAHPHLMAGLDPEELIDSLDTAVVEVRADVPAGAAKHRTFDVVVSALSVDPDTRSLANGYLLPCELKMYQEVSPAQIIEGRTHAHAHGPVFINPFLDSEAGAAPVNLREGRVIGGGANAIARRLGLVTAVESFAVVSQVVTAINRRFPGRPKTADGDTPTHVGLRVPEEYRGHEKRFVELVLHLPLSNSPAEQEARIKALVSELARADAPWDRIALALEGIGPRVIPPLQELYTDPRHQVSYHAARTCLRLGDDLAVEVVIHHARNPKSPFRIAAIRELGACSMPIRAGAALRALLSDDDPRVRVTAYEALREFDPGGVDHFVVGREEEGFVLDLIRCDGPPLVYARRTTERRIALFGGPDTLALHPPLLYAPPGRPVTITAKQGDRMVTVLRKEGGRLIGEFKVPLSVARLTHWLGGDPRRDIKGEPGGLGLGYASVLDVLYRLCETRAIHADMRWEEPSVEDIVGPLQPMGRPESEL